MKAVKYPVMAIGGWILSVLLIGLGSARADSIDLLETSYEVNIKGITVVDVEYSAGISDKDYHSQASVKTRGIVAFFSDYLMEMESSGSIVDGQAKPTQYTSLREKKNKTRQKQYQTRENKGT